MFSRPNLVAALAAGTVTGIGVFCPPVALPAQQVEAGRPVVVGVAAGLATPTGALGDFTNTGYSVTALAQSPARGRGRGVALRGELAYTALPGDRRARGATSAYADTRVLGGALTLVLLPTDPDGPPRPRLYFLGGVGLYRFDYGGAGAPAAAAAPADRTRAGFNVGAGVRFPFGRVRASLETRFHSGLGAAAVTRVVQPVSVTLTF